MKLFIAFMSSSVISALVAALVTLRINAKNIHIENVTQERAKWRNSMRTLSESIIKFARSDNFDTVSLLCSQLALNVNPFDSEDMALIQAGKKLCTVEDKEDQVEEFTQRMALLLKHDWERAKREARPWFFRGVKPRRIPYNEFKGLCSKEQPISPLNKKSLPLFFHFATLAFSAGIIFFLAANLVEPFQQLVVIFNDPINNYPIWAWVKFFFWSVFYGSTWSALYLWFKASEKKFLEIWFAK